MSIHKTAIVDPGAQIDPSCDIGPYAIIGPDVAMGPRNRVGAHSVVEYTHMGADNIMHPGCYVGTAPQDLKYAGEKTLLRMGDKNTVRECVTLNRGTGDKGETVIGNSCLFMLSSHVAHDCRLGDGVIMANSVALAGHIEIGDYCVLGGIVAVHQFTRLGRYSMYGGGAMVNMDVLPFTNAQGDRAKTRGLNLIGLRRAGFSRESVKNMKAAYQTLFLSGLSWNDAVAKLRTINTPEVQEWVKFIDGSKRGITKADSTRPVKEEVAS